MALTLRVTEADEAAIEELKALTGQVTASGAIMAAVRDYARQLELVQHHQRDANSLRGQLSDIRVVVTSYQQAAAALLSYKI